MTGSKQPDGDHANLTAVLAHVAEGRYDAAVRDHAATFAALLECDYGS